MILLWSVTIQAQNKVISFDGVNDYINLGNTVATGARTIEMWFSPGVNISSTSSSYYPLLVRDETPNNKEFGLTFIPNSGAFGGQLMFYTYHNNNSNISFRIYSNSSAWNAGQWYHVAGVFHPTQGMMLFIDGIKQNSVNTNTLAPTQSITNTNIGTFGSVNNRNFDGKIDNLRLSSTALYSSNFTPSCSAITSSSSTLGLYKFNGNSISPNAIDSSGNMNNGIIYGVIGSVDTICKLTTELNLIKKAGDNVSIFPNPFKNQVTFQFNNSSIPKLIKLYSIDGRLIIEKQVSSFVTIGTEGLAKGLYFVQVIESEQIVVSQKLVKE